MKKITCPDCTEEFQAETEKEVLDAMHPHYMGSHKEIISSANEEQKKEWMAAFHENWEKAEEV
jgi:hypothetical protein